jgi:hypothetical protein
VYIFYSFLITFLNLFVFYFKLLFKLFYSSKANDARTAKKRPVAAKPQLLPKRHISWKSCTGCILGPFKKLIFDHRHKQAQAQASASELDFIKASSDRVPRTSDRVRRIDAKGQKIVDRGTLIKF